LGEPVSAFRSRKIHANGAGRETRSYFFDSIHYAFGILRDDVSLPRFAWDRLMEKQIKLITIEPRNEANKSVSSLSREKNELMNKKKPENENDLPRDRGEMMNGTRKAILDYAGRSHGRLNERNGKKELMHFARSFMGSAPNANCVHFS
jgi:hypothetical protein